MSSSGRLENLVWRSGLSNWCKGCMQIGRSHVCVGEGYSEEFEENVGVH